MLYDGNGVSPRTGCTSLGTSSASTNNPAWTTSTGAFTITTSWTLSPTSTYKASMDLGRLEFTNPACATSSADAACELAGLPNVFTAENSITIV